MNKLWYLLAILGAPNRLRGSYGWFAGVFGIVITATMYWAAGSWLVAVLFGVGYWLGEAICGWGSPMGNLTIHRATRYDKMPDDGDAVGVRWLTSVIVYPKLWKLHLRNAKVGLWNIYPRTINMAVKGWSIGRILGISIQLKPIEEFVIDKAMTYNRVFLVIRGIYWWALPMIGVSMLVGVVPAVVALAVLSLGWPIAAELGYYIGEAKGKVYKFWGLSYEHGWEWQEGMYGVLQDLVVIGLVIWML